MAEGDFDDRSRATEDEYFYKTDRELIEKMRKAAADETARSEMAARIRINEPGLIKDLQELGFTQRNAIDSRDAGGGGTRGGHDLSRRHHPLLRAHRRGIRGHFRNRQGFRRGARDACPDRGGVETARVKPQGRLVERGRNLSSLALRLKRLRALLYRQSNWIAFHWSDEGNAYLIDRSVD
jgi:hypothetical protein